MQPTRPRAGTRRLAALVVIIGFVVAGCAGGGDHGSSPGAATPVPSTTGAGPATTTSSAASTSATTAPATAPTTPGGKPQQFEPALPIAIQEAAAASVGNLLYVVGGYDSSRNSSATVFVFDGTSWHRGPPLPIAVNHPGAAAIGGDVYVAGGFTPGGATNRVFVLTAGNANWRELAPMHQPRGALALISLGGRLYAIGGRDGSVQIGATEAYDPTVATWSALTPMPSPRNHVGGYVDGALACVAGGRTPATSAAVDCLDPATSTWQRRATLPTSTSGAAAGVINGVTIVAGGEPADETHLVGVVQTLRQGVWAASAMLIPRHGAAFALYRGRLWACGGATTPGFHATNSCTSLGE